MQFPRYWGAFADAASAQAAQAAARKWLDNYCCPKKPPDKPTSASTCCLTDSGLLKVADKICQCLHDIFGAPDIVSKPPPEVKQDDAYYTDILPSDKWTWDVDEDWIP